MAFFSIAQVVSTNFSSVRDGNALTRMLPLFFGTVLFMILLRLLPNGSLLIVGTQSPSVQDGRLLNQSGRMYKKTYHINLDTNK